MPDGPSRTIVLRSARIAFGLWRADDDALATAIWGDPRVTRLTGGPFTLAQVRARLDLERATWRTYGLCYWPIFARDGGDPIGCCGLRPRDVPARIFEFGFQLIPAAWGQGYASEAGRAVIAWSARHKLAGLMAGHHPDNAASRRALLRLGFGYTHHEIYPPTGVSEPCYALPLTAAY